MNRQTAPNRKPLRNLLRQHRRRSMVVVVLLVVPLLLAAIAACSQDGSAERSNPTAALATVPALTSTSATAVEEQDDQAIASTGGMTDTTPISDTTTDPVLGMPGEEHSVYTIGDVIVVGNLVLTVTNVTKPPPADVSSSEEGTRFLGVNMTIGNTGTEAQTISSLLQLSLYDEANQRYNPTLNASLAAGGGRLQTPDGSIAAGEQTQGTIGFELPATATDLRLVFDTLAENEETVTIELEEP